MANKKTKAEVREKKKRIRPKVSGRSVFTIKDILVKPKRKKDKKK